MNDPDTSNPERIPDWIPASLRPVLPGGREWDTDREAGHPVLAIRLLKLSSSSIHTTQRTNVGTLVDQATMEIGREIGDHQLPISFRGCLTIQVAVGDDSPSVLLEREAGWTEDGVGYDCESYALPVDTRRLYRYLKELLAPEADGYSRLKPTGF